MLNTQELIEYAISLPIEERANIVDSLLKSINRPNKAIDKKWINIAKKRLDDLRTGKVQAIPGDIVFNKVKELFEK